jgi:hypothetical protein
MAIADQPQKGTKAQKFDVDVVTSRSNDAAD